ncbi:MAG: penicillin-binding protein activator [Gammaproteobacteria bacterium]|nr:penicillin-binding protein activator [Gammaproteobacteria bacterium]
MLCISILSACETQLEKPSPKQAEAARPVSERQATLTGKATNLIEIADSSDSAAEEQQSRIKAAYLLIEAGEIPRAKEQLANVEAQFKNRQFLNATDAGTAQAAISLLATAIAIAEQNTQLASQLIADVRPITRQQQIEFYMHKADIDFLSGNYMFAVDRRTQLDRYIVDEKEKERNNQKIWGALSNLSSSQLKNQKSSNPVIEGWLDLARVMRSGQQNIGQLENDLLDWGTRHPLHPVSNSFLAKLISDYRIDVSTGQHIAVMLPLQGDLSQVADSIKNGLLSAYYDDTDSSIKPDIRFYDSKNEGATFNQLYQQALANGATTIIGPLDKGLIDQLAQQAELEIPVLTLNYSENEYSYTKNLYQFGLSPTDEARQVAELAIRQNKKRAAVFYPDSDWGKRLYTAFAERYESLGGKILSSADYATSTNDYKRPISALLNLNLSSIRRNRVENTIGEKTVSEPYRRQDIDMIFLAATHYSARGIIPAFKFNHAGDIPVYSTSHVYTGKINRELDRDLNGLIFCDLPWVLQNNSPLMNTFKQNWPQQESFTRLFALGVDAYHLIYNLDYLENRDYAFYAGQTGNIQLDEQNRITRKLLWAKFKNGVPVYFEPVFSTAENVSAVD